MRALGFSARVVLAKISSTARARAPAQEYKFLRVQSRATRVRFVTAEEPSPGERVERKRERRGGGRASVTAAGVKEDRPEIIRESKKEKSRISRGGAKLSRRAKALSSPLSISLFLSLTLSRFRARFRRGIYRRAETKPRRRDIDIGLRRASFIAAGRPTLTYGTAPRRGPA